MSNTTPKKQVHKTSKRQRNVETQHALLLFYKRAQDRYELIKDFQAATGRRMPETELAWMTLAAEYDFPGFGQGDFDEAMVYAWVVGRARAAGQQRDSDTEPASVDEPTAELSTKTHPKRKPRGRKRSADPAADKRVAEAWNTGQHRTLAGLDGERGVPEGDSKRAIDRDRKRK